MTTMNESYPEGPFCRAALKALDVSVSTNPQQLARIPTVGPTIAVCNHPFGAIEGIALLDLLSGRRDDVKMVANSVLRVFPDLADHCFFVNPFDTPASLKENIAAVRAALAHVKSGGMLVLFPAGEVSHFSFQTRRITDPLWRDTAAKIAKQAGATVIPLYINGRNTLRFQIAGLFHPMLRTAMLPSELFNKRGKTLNLEIGTAISRRKVSEFESSKKLCEYLRTRTYALEARAHLSEKQPSEAAHQDPIIPPIAPEKLLRDIDGLPESTCLVKHKQMAVFLVEYDQAPAAMMEIGRLREETFRGVGEGTGKSFDLDAYDRYYRHLILWDHASSRIAGAYRLGAADQIVGRFGFKGLYTNSLFRFSSKTKKMLSNALELGRSFVISEYQRKPLSLALLWKGIGRYIQANPRHRILFGPVTISAAYNEASMAIITKYFERRLADRTGRLIRPKTPVRTKRFIKWDMESVMRGLYSDDDLSTIIRDLEDDAKGLPILVRQYLNLHGKILAFNLDKDFSDGVDGLVVVDLLDTPKEILRRFMGAEGADRFFSFHGAGHAIQIAS